MAKEEFILAEEQQAKNFLNDLTMLCHKHGIGITQDAVLFVMERDDQNLRWGVDADCKLELQ